MAGKSGWVLPDERKASFIAVVGAQWGDEGKGKLVDVLAQTADIVARFNGGANAGHTLVLPSGTAVGLHLVPCGITNPRVECFLGAGVVLHLETLRGELESLEAHLPGCAKRMKICNRVHLLFDLHKQLDCVLEAQAENSATRNAIGTTKSGIGPCYSHKVNRVGIRAEDLSDFSQLRKKYEALVADAEAQFPALRGRLDPAAEMDRLQPFAEAMGLQVVDGVQYLHDAMSQRKAILAEGANGVLLDINFGTYPFVTSSNTIIGNASCGLGVPPKSVEACIGVVKAYSTRVGNGIFPTELFDANGAHLQSVGREFGTTTGRPRRCGWLDIPSAKYSIALCGYECLAITKFDILSGLKELKICTGYTKGSNNKDSSETQTLLGQQSFGMVDSSCTPIYETLPGWTEDITSARKFSDLPTNAQNYLKVVQSHLRVPILWVSVGPNREALLECSIPAL